ncbi:MAG: trimeric intracellular cation channel family protein [Verrucomicrobia bacterium]|nr:trimeric intracellular cation channel family protein [Verrucomicrobiota bacterium]
MQTWLEHFGVAVAAITGVLAARGKRVDLFGVIVLAVVTAFGGGTVRDLCLGDTPVFWIENPRYLLNAVGVAVLTFFAARVREFPGTVLLVADAFALAFFTMVGVKKSLVLGTAPSIAVAMGVITGVVGGVIRDVLTREIPLVFRQQIYLYATASLIGAVVFIFLNRWLPDEHINTILATIITLGLRLGAIRWKLTLPEFEPRDPDGPARQ